MIAAILIGAQRAFEKPVPARFGWCGFLCRTIFKKPNFENHLL